jgi:hypothetical protein
MDRARVRIARRAVAGLLVAAAVAGAAATAQAAGSITIYSGQHEQTTGALVLCYEHRTGMSM